MHEKTVQRRSRMVDKEAPNRRRYSAMRRKRRRVSNAGAAARIRNENPLCGAFGRGGETHRPLGQGRSMVHKAHTDASSRGKGRHRCHKRDGKSRSAHCHLDLPCVSKQGKQTIKTTFLPIFAFEYLLWTKAGTFFLGTMKAAALALHAPKQRAWL
jgi:hypothetical protein